jgi:PKD repeat protein
MNRLTLTLFLALLVLASGAFAEKTKIVPPQEGASFVGYAPERCVVIFKEGAPPVRGNQELTQIAQQFGVGKFARQFPAAKASHPVDAPLTRFYKAHFPEGNLDKVMEAYSKLPFVEKVEPVEIFRLTATPNDFHYDDSTGGFPYTQWHYWDTYGISADLAWDIETGSSDVIVAVADAGVKYDHFELGGSNPPGPADNSTNGNIWVNDGEIPGNGQDDDNNGYVDDVIGWDFVSNASQCSDADCSVADNDPRDGNGHGTHVAGTIGAITNNYAPWGVAGVAGGWNDGTETGPATGVRIMCLRIGWNSPLGGLIGMDYAAEAFYYIATMVDKGYNITAVNCSWGSSSYLNAATNAVLARDVMVIVAAGNSNSSSCDYLGCRTDCLDVGGTQRNGNPYASSNYGSWVDIAAPAVDILSTYTDPGDPSGDYIALMTGTSMACPHVVAVAGLLESYDPTLTSADKWDIITDVNNTKPYNQTKYVGVGIVDARKCLDAVGPGCDLVADFSGTPTSGCASLLVSFTDASTGTGIDGWDWDFGDGVGTSTAQNPNYTYPNPGTYTVTLTVSSSSQSCDDTEVKTGYITVQGSPVADFSGAPLSGNAPLLVSFTDLSTGNPDTWSWDFGDGIGTSSLQNPDYTYNDEGTYTVTLTASNACGSDVETKVDYINVTISQATTAYALSDISVLGTYSGSFLDTYASDNVYEVITEALSTGHPVKVTSNAEHKWTFNLGSGGSNMMFYVEAYRPNNSDGDNFIFAYSTDDATYNNMVTVAGATEQVYSYAPPAGLTGTVYVRVVDSDRTWGNTSLDDVYVDEMYFSFETTPGPPIADFVGNPTSGVAPLTVDFTDLSTGDPTSWSWDFGDGVGGSALQNPSYIYNNPGTYTVELTATNTYGSDTEIKTNYITVIDPSATVHVEAMTVTRTGNKQKQGVADVTIYDNGGSPVSGAVVYGYFNAPNTDTKSGTTGGGGVATILSDRTKTPPGDWCFTVTDVAAAGYTYDPGSNVVTQACESGPVYSAKGQPGAAVPEDFSMSNHPNPFNPSTVLSFNLPHDSHVRLEIYNILGERVETLVDEYLSAGSYSYEWDGSNAASGIYLYRMTADEFTATKKMLLMK